MEKIYIEYRGVRREAKISDCEYCTEEFKQRKNGSHRFCSAACASKFRGKKITLKCSHCEKTIQKTESDLKNSKHGRYFCNRQCKEKAQSLKGQCVEIRPSHYGLGTGRSTLRWKINKEACCDCGLDKAYMLEMHHIDGDHTNNDATNIEVVCANCHIKRHLKIENNQIVYDTDSLTPREDVSKY